MSQAQRPNDVTGLQHGESLTKRIAGQQPDPADGEVIKFEDIGKEPEVTATPTEASKTEPKQNVLPDKFKDKSVEELVSMYQNLETAYGRQGTEHGQLRQLVDKILLDKDSTTTAPKDEPRTPLSVDDLLADPEQAINRAVENHPKVKHAEQTAQSLEAQRAAAVLSARHSDYESVLASPEFAGWLKANPTMARIAYMGNMTMQPDDVAYVLDTFKAQSSQEQQTHQRQTDEAMRKASVETHTSGTPATGDRKVYFRRADLLRMQNEDRERYDRLYPQIAQAYKEKRVLD